MNIYYAIVKTGSQSDHEREFGYAYLYANSVESALKLWDVKCGFGITDIVLVDKAWGENGEFIGPYMVGYTDTNVWETVEQMFSVYASSKANLNVTSL